MGTTKPLKILVHPDLYQAGWVRELEAKGHLVGTWHGDNIFGVDLILGPNCARFLPGMEQFLDAFIKGARAIRYKKNG